MRARTRCLKSFCVGTTISFVSSRAKPPRSVDRDAKGSSYRTPQRSRALSGSAPPFASARAPAWGRASEVGRGSSPTRFYYELVRATDEILDRVAVDAREPDEDARVVEVVLFEIVRRRVVFDHRVALGEVHHHDERVRLRGRVRRDAHEHLSLHFQRRLPPCRRLFHVRQTATDGADGAKRDGACSHEKRRKYRTAVARARLQTPLPTLQGRRHRS